MAFVEERVAEIIRCTDDVAANESLRTVPDVHLLMIAFMRFLSRRGLELDPEVVSAVATTIKVVNHRAYEQGRKGGVGH